MSSWRWGAVSARRARFKAAAAADDDVADDDDDATKDEQAASNRTLARETSRLAHSACGDDNAPALALVPATPTTTSLPSAVNNASASLSRSCCCAVGSSCCSNTEIMREIFDSKCCNVAEISFLCVGVLVVVVDDDDDDVIPDDTCEVVVAAWDSGIGIV